MTNPKYSILMKGLAVLATVHMPPAVYGEHDQGFLAAMGGSIEPNSADMYSFFEGQCTSYTAWRLNQAGVPFHNHWRSGEIATCPVPPSGGRPQGASWNAGRWSHAWQWYYKARHLGLRIDNKPAVNAVYCSLTDSGYGHVGVVDSVGPDGSATIAEYNWRNDQQFSKRTGVRVDGTTEFFIHFTLPPAPPTPAPPWGLSHVVTHASAMLDWATSAAAARYRIQVSTRREGWNPGTGWDASDNRMPSATLPVNSTVQGAANSSYTWVQGSSGSLEGPRPSGTYFWTVRVVLPSGSASQYTAPMAFTMTAAPLPPRDDHANGLPGSTPLQLDSPQPGRLDTLDVDVFRIQMPTLRAVVLSTSGSTDTIGELLDASGRVLATNDDFNGNRNFRIESALPAGIYHLRIRGYQNSSGNYIVSALPVQDVPVVLGDDHGNAAISATLLTLGIPSVGRIETVGDADFFRIVVNAPRQINVVSLGTTDTVGDLLNSTGTLVASDDDSNGNRNFRIARVVEAGTYFLRVRGHGAGVGPYTVRFN